MSGSIGANRIPRAAVETTLKSYIEKVLNKFPGFKSAKISGSYNTSVKPDHGDLDLVIHIEGDEQDRKKLKQNFASYINSLPDNIAVPFTSGRHVGKKSAGTGDIVIVQFPIEGYPGLNVQIDNMIVASEQESNYRKSFLDLPAEKQGLLVGLAKAILLEENPTEVFKRLGITNAPKLDKNQEFEFNLSNKGLTLRLVTLGDNFKEIGRNEIWTSFNWNDVLKLFKNYKLDGTWEDLLQDIKSKLKNPRSKNRVKGVFNSLVVINAGEAGTPKGDNKLAAKTKVDSILENMLFKGLVKELISDLLYEEITRESIALYPGKFKPPHKGHFEVAKKLLNIADKIEILISAKPVEGITAEQSKAVWDLYNTLLDGKLDIKIISGSPVKYVLDTIEANQNNNYIAVYGKGEEDRYRNIGKDPRYMNAKIFDGGTTVTQDGNINATDFRQALQSGQDISKFLPTGISPKEINNIFNPQEKVSKIELNENCGCQQPNTFKQALASLTKYMIDQGLNIKPLPKLIIINSDTKNAENILGKTAYYNPNNCSITLYTLNRHPKDVLRSYSHEMIHRIQDNEGRLNNVDTTNTNENSNLQELEKEAYLNGNIIFRNWEDSIKNQKYIKEYKEYALNELFEKDLPNIKKNSKTSYIVGNGKDIEAEYYFRRIDIDNDIWAIGWSFTDNNQNTSPEAWKQVTATSFKVLNDFIKNKNPKQIEISGNTDSKTNIYKSPSFLKKLETIFNNQYKIDNSPEYSVIMKLIEVLSQSSIQKRINTLNESYEQALNYWQNGDLNSKSKIERWNTIKRKIEREVLQEIYNIK